MNTIVQNERTLITQTAKASHDMKGSTISANHGANQQQIPRITIFATEKSGNSSQPRANVRSHQNLNVRQLEDQEAHPLYPSSDS